MYNWVIWTIMALGIYLVVCFWLYDQRAAKLAEIEAIQEAMGKALGEDDG